MALAQTAVLAYMVTDRVRLLSSGREITLPIIPVDPRDLFRGEYVRLGYDIGRVPVSLLDGPAPGANDPFYVVIEKQADGAWKPVKVSRAFPKETSPDRVVLKGRAGLRADAVEHRPTRRSRCATASRAISCPKARASGSRTWPGRSAWRR